MDTSRLALLPRELRDIIYEYVFIARHPYAVTLQSGHTEHPLTKTCHQVRRETLAMYYSLTRFNAHLDEGPVTPLVRWFQTIGPELTLKMREVNVWDLHDRIATLYSPAAATDRLLNLSCDALPSERWILKPLSGLLLGDLASALREMGLVIFRFGVCDATPSPMLTSEFAIVRSGGVEGKIERAVLEGSRREFEQVRICDDGGRVEATSVNERGDGAVRM